MAKSADPPASRIDDEVVAGARDGDPTAWAVIVRELGPTVRGLARAKGVSDPDDLTQDVFVAVATSLEGFEGDVSAFRSWLFSIAYRKIIDRWRRRGPRHEPAELPHHLVDASARGPEEITIRGTMAADAMAALDVLNDTERDVVLLRVLAGLETAEVAGVVGKRPGNVRVIQSRALKKLRAELERSGYARRSGVLERSTRGDSP